MKCLTVAELKKYICHEGKIEYVLEQIGCHDIVYHHHKEYYSCSNYDGDNKAAVNIKNNEYLNCKNYTRKGFDERADLITLVQFNNKIDFVGAVKYLHSILGLKLSPFKKHSKTEKDEVDPLRIFKKVKSKRTQCNVLDINSLSENVVNDFVPYIHIDWFREGICPWTVKKFGLAYSYKHKRNVIPLRYWLDGSLLGFNQRTTVDNYDLLGIQKYFITPDYPKQLNLFGLWENRESIIKAGYVVVYESEKSTLKRDSLDDPTGVSLSGHTMSDEQARILIGLNVTIIIALDKDIDEQEVRHMCERFYGIRSIYYLKDKYDLLGTKDSPADASDKIFKYLMQYKVKYDAIEHKKYVKNFQKKVGV